MQHNFNFKIAVVNLFRYSQKTIFKLSVPLDSGEKIKG